MSKKKQVNISELDNFLSQDSFTKKEENDIWVKFGHITGLGKYYLHWNKHRAEIVSRGVKYFYLVKQIHGVKNTPWKFEKISRDEGMSDEAYSGKARSIFDDPQNHWNDDLIWSDEKGWYKLSELPPVVKLSAEDEAMSIIENVVLASVKKFGKDSDNWSNSKKTHFYLDKNNFCYEYVGHDKQWHVFFPTTEKLLTYARKNDRQEFLSFLLTEEYNWHRDYWDNLT